MKKIFSKVFILTILLSTSVLFASPLKSKFLDSYYSSGYFLGKSTETKVNNETVIVSEVLNKENGQIKGYVAVDKITNEVLYLVDYLSETKEIKAISIKNNKTDIINLQKENQFESFIKIDLVKEIEKINLNGSSALKFWGESCGPSWTTPTGECYRSCSYYVMWVNTGTYIEGC